MLAPPTYMHNNKERSNNTRGANLQKPQLAHSCFGDYFASLKTFTMVDAFCATWKLVDSENFDDYMKALGEYDTCLSMLFLCNETRWGKKLLQNRP